MNQETIVAMAAAAIAEELHTDVKRIRVISFREVGKSSLQAFIEEHGITYKKYQLGDSCHE